jgi:hypothetical protein
MQRLGVTDSSGQPLQLGISVVIYANVQATKLRLTHFPSTAAQRPST